MRYTLKKTKRLLKLNLAYGLIASELNTLQDNPIFRRHVASASQYLLPKYPYEILRFSLIGSGQKFKDDPLLTYLLWYSVERIAETHPSMFLECVARSENLTILSLGVKRLLHFPATKT